MIRKKRLVVGILVVILLSVGIGGKVYMEKRAEHKQQEQIKVERQSVKALKNTFADIKEVKIEQTIHNNMTGYYTMAAEMVNTQGSQVFFNYGFQTAHNKIKVYSIHDRVVQKVGITRSKIKVTYSDHTVEEI